MSNNLIEEKIIDNDEEYQIIKEDYHSSPRCGIRAKSVRNTFNNIIFSPIEISTKPYCKYCVIPIKEEQKNDISQNETNNQTKINDDKSKYNNTTMKINNNTMNIDELKISTNHISKEKEEKEEEGINKEEEENDEEKESDEDINYNYIHIVEKKSSEMTLNAYDKVDEEKIDDNDNNNLKNKKSKKKNLNSMNSMRVKDNKSAKLKFEDEQNKIAQNNLINFFNNNFLTKSNHSNKIHSKMLPNDGSKNIYKTKSIFKEKNNEKKYSPKTINIKKNKSEPIKIASAFTTNNIKRIKRKKDDIKKVKTIVTRQHSFIPVHKNKKSKIHNEDKDKDIKELKNKRRFSQLHKNELKNNNNIFINILNNNENRKSKKNKIKHQKMKSSMDNINNDLDSKKHEHDHYNTPKKKGNYISKLKIEDSIRNSDRDRMHELKTTKGKKRVSIFQNCNNESKKRKRLHTEEKREGIIHNNNNKKKNTFSGLKDKDRDKEKEKEKNNKEKEKEKKFKSKKHKKYKLKDKDGKNKKESSNNNNKIKKIKRKDQSFTIVSQTNKNLIDDDDDLILLNNNNNNTFNSTESNIKLDDNKGKNNTVKPSPNINNNNSPNNRGEIRRNSTRDLFRQNDRKEKIIALTNKQTIENINEYTRSCLELIPELFKLGDKMPRCKTKINMNFSKDKKIALFDLDETIVHCIGEININNLEFLSRQSDAKIRVHLPGGKREVTIGINIRPHWEEALSKIKTKYHIVAFTASHESYADSVLNYLDPNKKYFEYRLYRCHCVYCDMKKDEIRFYIKDLKILEDNYDLKDIVIIDNSVLSFAYHLDNGIPISPFYDSKKDEELLEIADLLVKYADENDIRDILKEAYKLNEFLEILKDEDDDDGTEEGADSSDFGSGKEEDKNACTSKELPNKIRTSININVVNNKDLVNPNPQGNNISQTNIKLKEITNLFTDENKNEKEDIKLHTPNPIIDKKSKKNLHEFDKNYIRSRRKETQRFGINFKEEWKEKQRELKNK